MVEPQVDRVPVVVQGGLADAAVETRVERRVQRRLQAVGGPAGPGAGRRGVRVVRTRSGAASADGGATGAAVGAHGAGRRTAVRGRVRRGITAAAPRPHPRRLAAVIVRAGAATADAAAAAAAGGGAAAAGGAVSAAAPAPRAVTAAPSARYPLRRPRVGVRRRRRVYAAVVAGPDGPRYAVRAHVDDALLDGRQPRRRGPLRAARGRPVRFGGRRRVLVQARVVRVRLTVVPGAAALVPRPMVLVVHVDRVYSET